MNGGDRSGSGASPKRASLYPVKLHVEPQTDGRNRLTVAFRFILAIPHLILVGGPLAATVSWSWSSDDRWQLGTGGGLLGAVVFVVTVIAWFAILITGQHPQGLWNLSAFYLRWRVRAVAYSALFRDEYPPFGDGPYPAGIDLAPPAAERDRLTVALRLFLVIPHLLVVWALGIVWGITTIIAWFAILFTGRYPETLYDFGVGVFRWNIRLEAYLLLLRDDYPPFSLS